MEFFDPQRNFAVRSGAESSPVSDLEGAVKAMSKSNALSSQLEASAPLLKCVCVCVCVFMYDGQYMYIYLCLFIYLSIYLPIHISVYTCTCMYQVFTHVIVSRNIDLGVNLRIPRDL